MTTIGRRWGRNTGKAKRGREWEEIRKGAGKGKGKRDEKNGLEGMKRDEKVGREQTGGGGGPGGRD